MYNVCMGRRSKKRIFGWRKRIIAFVCSFVLLACGVFYITLNYVPQELYEEQQMLPNMKEAYYVSQWCRDDFGKREFVLWDNTRVDCLTKDYAIEFDFANKWAESIGQALHYEIMTNKKAKVVLILEDKNEMVYFKRVERLAKKYGFDAEYITEEILNPNKKGKCQNIKCKCHN